MGTMIVACNTISDELNAAVKETGCDHPIRWIESGLHRSTESLHERLRQELAAIGEVQRVLLAFGFCGNALLDLQPSAFQLIFPRVDDCITLLLSSQELPKQMGTYYMTKGWLAYENNIWQEYQDAVSRHGQAKADRIYRVILAHYGQLAVIDTGAYDYQGFLDEATTIASSLGLERQPAAGTLRYLKKLITGPWDEEFVVIEPGNTVTLEHLQLA